MRRPPYSTGEDTVFSVDSGPGRALVIKQLLMAETEQRAGKVAELAGVLSAEARARIIQLLKERALCVGALAARLEITSAAVSQHLRILKAAGLVEPERRGNFVHYRLNPERLAEVQRRFDRLLSTDEQD